MANIFIWMFHANFSGSVCVCVVDMLSFEFAKLVKLNKFFSVYTAPKLFKLNFIKRSTCRRKHIQ